jgi:GT2 family glycosyltransferase
MAGPSTGQLGEIMTQLGFVILSYNSLREAACLAETLRDAIRGSPHIIFLIDNASPCRAGECEWRAVDGPNVRHLVLPVNGGYSAGNNSGIDAALAEGVENVIILNPDTTLRDPRAFVLEVVRHFERDAFLCIGFPVQGVPPYIMGIGVWALTFPAVTRALDRLRPRAGDESVDSVRPVGRIHGCAFGLRARAFRALGLFDERIFLYGEEAIVSLVAQRSGSPIVQSRLVSVDHGTEQSLDTINWAAFRWQYRSTSYILREYCGIPRWFAGALSRLSVAQLVTLKLMALGLRRGRDAARQLAPWRRPAPSVSVGELRADAGDMGDASEGQNARVR